MFANISIDQPMASPGPRPRFSLDKYKTLDQPTNETVDLKPAISTEPNQPYAYNKPKFSLQNYKTPTANVTTDPAPEPEINPLDIKKPKFTLASLYNKPVETKP